MRAVLRIAAAGAVAATLACASAPAFPQALPAAPPPGTGAPAMQALQGALLADPGTREDILSLQDDPAVQRILRDEQTMRAIDSGDLGRLLADPKLRALAAHPKVQGIIQRQGR